MGSSQSNNNSSASEKSRKLINDAAAEQQTSILKHGILDIQYGLGGNIQSRRVVITHNSLQIDDIEQKDDEDEKSQYAEDPSVTFNFDQLLNIDDACTSSRSHVLQLLLNDALHPSVYVYCRSASEKRAWLQTCVQLCPRFILTKELQTLKECAVNCGFSEARIEEALTRYHAKYGTVYNVDVFVCVLQNDYSDTGSNGGGDSDGKDDDDAVVPKDLQCVICHERYTQPVRNLCGTTYCRHCIASWFENIQPEQTQITDPWTRQRLPLHCRLLMPYFSKMSEVWNYQHVKRQISDQVITKLKEIDDAINDHRKNILCALQKSADIERMSETMTDRFMSNDKDILHHEDMDDVIGEALQCHQWLAQLQKCIENGTKIYNHSISNCGGGGKDVFEWKAPEWKNSIDKSSINWCDIYQIDETLQNELYTHTTECMEQISNLMKSQTLSVAELKQKILQIVKQKQTEILQAAKTEHQARYVQKQKSNSDNNMKQKPKVRTRRRNKHKNRLDVQRIMYAEKHGLVNTQCLREIAECLQNKQAFELYHNDMQHKVMKRDFLVRFLDTSGWNGVEYLHYLYEAFAMRMKDKMLRLSAHLNSKTTAKECTAGKVQFYRHLKKVEVEPQKVLHPTKWTDNNDCVQLRVTFGLDFDEHLARFGGDKQALAQAIKQQTLRQLKLKQAVLADAYISVTEIKKGSIVTVFKFLHPFVSVVGIAGGLLHCGVCLYKHSTDRNYYIPTKQAIMQGAAVGGGIGAFIGAAAPAALASTAAAAALGPVGVAVGCALAGAVVCGLLGWGIWSLLKRWKRRRQEQVPTMPQLQAPLTHDGDDGGDGDGGDDDHGDNDCKHDAVVGQPGAGRGARDNDDDDDLERLSRRMRASVDVDIGDIDRRIRENVANSEFQMGLDCGCMLPYDDESARTEGGWYRCQRHGQLTNVATMESRIQQKLDARAHNRNAGDSRIAVIRSVHIFPLGADDEFDTGSTSSEAEHDDNE